MKEIGRIIEVNNDTAKVLIARHAACGDCGACQVGRENLNMILTAENTINGNPGDTVEIELKTENFLFASFIMYGIPLLGLIIGLLGGYYSGGALGYDESKSQVIAAVSGLLILTMSYLGIRFNESKIKNMHKFKPVLIRIVRD
ncbi:SoxR reducing system RseC family protein [Lutispora sp.]|uniref:SoxR reducing system RseC family protein n=1 Tax=Lutispora sp. TaxID=2828727 RepID=UPI00356A534B